MVALTNYEEHVNTVVKEGVDFIISGAGLPLMFRSIASTPSILASKRSWAPTLSMIERQFLLEEIKAVLIPNLRISWIKLIVVR